MSALNPEPEYKPENVLRMLLWLHHGCSGPALYGDDGEMQCNACHIDFKRDSVKDINDAFARRELEQFRNRLGV